MDRVPDTQWKPNLIAYSCLSFMIINVVLVCLFLEEKIGNSGSVAYIFFVFVVWNGVGFSTV
jgi:hypothetical protein